MRPALRFWTPGSYTLYISTVPYLRQDPNVHRRCPGPSYCRTLHSNPNHDGRYHAVLQRVDSASYGLTLGVAVVPLQSASNDQFHLARPCVTCRPTKTWPGCRSSFGACIQASAPERLPDTPCPPHRYSRPPLPHPLNVRRRFPTGPICIGE